MFGGKKKKSATKHVKPLSTTIGAWQGHLPVTEQSQQEHLPSVSSNEGFSGGAYGKEPACPCR